MNVNHRVKARRRFGTRCRAALLAVAASSLMAPMVAAPERPDELHGEVVALRGDRIILKLSQQEWVAYPGTTVELGAEMAGMWVPLKGRFTIVQIDADFLEAMPVGSDAHGTPAPGMKFVAKPPGYWLVRRRADIVSLRQQTASILPAAERGDAYWQHSLAEWFELMGDHDNALVWWERAMAASSDRTIVSSSARGRAKILLIRQDATSAAAILEAAIAKTTPAAHERGLQNYAEGIVGPLQSHIRLLRDLGEIHWSRPDHRDEATRAYRAAAQLMSAAASSEVPSPGEPNYQVFQDLVMDLVMLYEHRLDDRRAAIPWLQQLARTGHTAAQSQLTSWGERW